MSISREVMNKIYSDYIMPTLIYNPLNNHEVYDKLKTTQECVSCGEKIALVKRGKNHSHYCPNCGAYLPELIYFI